MESYTPENKSYFLMQYIKEITARKQSRPRRYSKVKLQAILGLYKAKRSETILGMIEV